MVKPGLNPTAFKDTTANDDEDLERAGLGQTIATVERAADVLVVFAQSQEPTLGVTQIANALSLSKAAVHRILASLRSRDLIEFDNRTRRYRLGPMALSIGLSYLSRVDVRYLAQDELAQLSAVTSETATLSIRNGRHRYYIDQVRPHREIVMSVQIGVPYPLHAGSSSKIFLAFLPVEEAERYLAGRLDKVTKQTVTSAAALRRDMVRIRECGYATSIGERQSDAASVAAPIFDHEGKVAAVLSVCGPADRFEAEARDVVPALLSAATRVSARMGYLPSTAAQGLQRVKS
ncbi:IclR family transcriptional regulator [Dactylosporangium roseum]|uniref:IclR family transcriptional regulator n=1 Tax=Dactylosporangium roseum TaxID=47989 RepID=A0ABY5YWX3_9ACTN|nr:IclR family transcriptional regulator [Dactylosporangium roseum]